jgi:hypothetical protein
MVPRNTGLAVILLAACGDRAFTPVPTVPVDPVPDSEPVSTCDSAVMDLESFVAPSLCEDTDVWDPPRLRQGARPGWDLLAVGPLVDTNGDGLVDRLDHPFLTGWIRAGDSAGNGFVVEGATGHSVELARWGPEWLFDPLDGEGHRIWMVETRATSSAGPRHRQWTPGDVLREAVGDLPRGSCFGRFQPGSSVVGPVFPMRGVELWDIASFSRIASRPDLDLSWGACRFVETNGSGVRRLLADTVILDETLSVVCEHQSPFLDFAAIDVDEDETGEVVAILAVGSSRSGDVVVVDGCTIRQTIVAADSLGDSGAHPFQMSIADFDGDGTSELFLGLRRRLGPGLGDEWTAMVVGFDGRVRWRNDEPYHVSQARVSEVVSVDFNGDGAYEIVGAGGRIYDGRSGAILARLADVSDLEEFAALRYFVADLDLDGSLELIAALDNGAGQSHRGFEVYTATDRWASGPTCWPSFPYDGTNIGPDCEIPLDPLPPWKAGNTYRAAPPAKAPVVDHGADLTARFVDVCEHECDEHRIRLGVQVGNLGLRPIRDPVVLQVYGYKEGARELLAVERVPEVPATTWVEGFDLWLPSDGGYDDLEAVVTIDGAAVRQCDEANDAVRLGRPVCRE